MPLYDYSCQACGDRFEKLIRGDTNGARIVCPSRASAAVTRVLNLRDSSSGGWEHSASTAGGGRFGSVLVGFLLR